MEVVTRLGTDRTTKDERRIAPRHTSVLHAKVFHPTLDRYVPCMTTNVSEGGVLIRIERSRPLMVGDEIRIALDWSQAGLCGNDRMRTAQVVRVTPIDAHHQAVALQFLNGGCKDGPCSRQVELKIDGRLENVEPELELAAA